MYIGIMLHLLVKTTRPYFDALGLWLEEGRLPVGSESWFMVARNESISSSSSSLPAPVAWGEGYVVKPDKVPCMTIMDMKKDERIKRIEGSKDRRIEG
jgi:Gamma tubulin complex component N-terminal